MALLRERDKILDDLNDERRISQAYYAEMLSDLDTFRDQQAQKD